MYIYYLWVSSKGPERLRIGTLLSCVNTIMTIVQTSLFDNTMCDIWIRIGSQNKEEVPITYSKCTDIYLEMLI